MKDEEKHTAYSGYRCEYHIHLNCFKPYEELVTAVNSSSITTNHWRCQYKLNSLPRTTYRNLPEAA